MEEIKGAWLASAMGIFFGWAFLAWLVRVWAKLRTQAWTLDDYAISGSVLAAFLHLVFVSYAIRHGYGKELDTLSDSNVIAIQTGLYLAHILYVISFGLCRAASATFIAYISHSGPHIKPAQVVAIVTVVWTVASTLAIGIRGNLAHPWTVLDGSSAMFIRWIAIEVTGIVIELTLWGMAAHLVWGIQLKVSKRIMIICAFGTRLLVVPFLVARVVFLDPTMNTGPAHSATMADLLTEACIHFSILAGSATALKPLLTSFYATHPAMDMTTSTTGLRSKDRSGGDPYYRLETVKPAVMNNNQGGTSRKVVINRAAATDITWQASAGSHQASAYSRSDNNSASRSVTNSRADNGSGHRRRDTLTGALKSGRIQKEQHVSSHSDDSGRMIIQKTTEVTVDYR
ncbi:hypothetical protein NLG97_g6722 [Lecanicillium saksenae]|uniref:Uncharacterized protein n=1 Tax=Lecanicillium saksenae TaxID=468837 RepID=A0ACC1QQ52_9HYPO|nr:hypothetical protein NLG97_g6722 [Lecanicillium saksenae]